MSLETILDAGVVSFFIVIGILVAIAAIYYCFAKKKKNYESKGVPKMVDTDPEKKGSTDK